MTMILIIITHQPRPAHLCVGFPHMLSTCVFLLREALTYVWSNALTLDEPYGRFP